MTHRGPFQPRPFCDSEPFKNRLQIQALKKITLLACNILHFLLPALRQSNNRGTVYVGAPWPFLKVYLTWRRRLFKSKRMLCNKPNFGISALQPAPDSAGALLVKQAFTGIPASGTDPQPF